MADVVFVLGAGASKEAGVPLMGEFLEAAEDLLRLGKIRSPDRLEKVFRARSLLQRAHSKAQLNIRNVEDVFAAFEMARILGTGFLSEAGSPEELAEAMTSLIVETVEATFGLPFREQTVYPPRPYGRFCEILVRLRTGVQPRRSVAIITFNYDLALESAFSFAGVPLAYGLEEQTAGDVVPVLKLHGSLNWGRCSKEGCGRIVPMQLKQAYPGFPGGIPIGQQSEKLCLPVCDKVAAMKCPHCGASASPLPFIAPPTWNKSSYYSALAPVWKRAAHELSEAEDLIVIGYSLPDSDYFFKDLYALGCIGDRLLRRFWVIDPGSKAVVEGRFKALLGPGALDCFVHHDATFSEAVSWQLEGPLWHFAQ